jgi:choline dehydrogenase-like flavoprotein
VSRPDSPALSLVPDDGRDLDLSCDLVVVGSGAAGAAVADVLAEAGHEVLVVEEGRHLPLAERREEMLHVLGDHFRDFGGTPARGRSIIPILQAKLVGGTTTVNAAITWRMPEAIHVRWQREFGLGGALPWDEVQAAYDWLDDELCVRPVEPDVIGGNGGLMAAGARALGLTGRVIERIERGCTGTNRCLQACPHGAKLSMERSLLPRACGNGAWILSSARVEHITRTAGRASGVTGRMTGSGRPVAVAARKGVVLAASATGSPILLQRSGIRHARVGAHFQAHPGVGLAGLFDQEVRPWAGATQSWESAHHWDRRIKLESLSLPLSLLIARLPGVGRALAQRLDALAHVAVWGLQVRARAEGSVRPGWGGSPSIRYKLTSADLGTFQDGMRVLAEMFFAAGAREVWPGVHGLPERLTSPDQLPLLTRDTLDPRHAHFIATHLFGTCRMGADPSASVVDHGFEVHGLPGCWVVDSSVFPTNLGVNPQHTILALARIAGQRIDGRVGG